MTTTKKYDAKLVSIIPETSDVNTFVFSFDQDFIFVPGQYIFLEIPGFDIKKPFSILKYDPEKKELSLGIKKHAEFTNKLWTLKEGTKVNIIGPYGRFCTNNNKTVFIAGGIGITPIYNLITNRNKKDDFLFFSSRTEKNMPYISQIQKFKNINKNLFFTREYSDKGLNCRISSEHILKKLDNPSDYEFMICGPENMINSLREQLIKSGISEEKIKSEVF